MYNYWCLFFGKFDTSDMLLDSVVPGNVVEKKPWSILRNAIATGDDYGSVDELVSSI